MTKITHIDRNTCRIVRDKIDAALKELGEELGLKMRTGRATFGAHRIDFKLEVGVAEPAATGETPEGRAFKALASHYGLASTDLGKTFYYRGRAYKVTGMNASRPKYPISAEEVGSRKGFKFPASIVRNALAHVG